MHESTYKLDGRKLEHWEHERHTSKTSLTQGKIATDSCNLLQPCICYMESKKRCGLAEEDNDSRKGSRHYQS